MAPASRTHGTLQGELGRLIGNHLRDPGSACTLVVTSGVVLPFRRIGAHRRIRLADVLTLRAHEEPARQALETLAADIEGLE